MIFTEHSLEPTEQVLHLGSLIPLWEEWGREEGRKTDTPAFVRELCEGIAKGTTCLVRAYDEGQLIGFCVCSVFYDSGTSKVTGLGDHAYIVPHQRSSGTYRKIIEQCETLAVQWECEQSIIYARSDGFLIRAYERRGHVITDHILRRGRRGEKL